MKNGLEARVRIPAKYSAFPVGVRAQRSALACVHP